MTELFADVAPELRAVIVRPPRREFLKTEALKNAFIEQIRALSGAESEYLVSRYFALGFAADDTNSCASSRWWRRLDGVVNLALLETPDLSPLFTRLTHDPHELVCAHALLALSYLENGSHAISDEALHRLARMGRGNLLMEVATNLSKRRPHAAILDMALACENNELKEVLISALVLLKTPELGADLAGLLDRAENFPAHLLRVMIRALTDIGDPEALWIVSAFENHSDEGVRFHAIAFVLAHAENPGRDAEKFKNEESVPIRRLLKLWTEKDAA